MDINKNHEIVKLHKAFKSYRKDMRDIWESYNLLKYYLNHIHNQVKDEKLSGLKTTNLYSRKNIEKSKKSTLGAISSFQRKRNSRRTLIDCVSRFEDYLTLLVSNVYESYPHKLMSKKMEGDYGKLLKLIINSNDKNEMMDVIIEEKIRSIFYGNPLDFFIKDKCKLEFKNHFKNNYSQELGLLREIIATRNITIHNNSKVDKKYLREIKESKYNEGQIVNVNDEYLNGTIALLEGLASEATRLVIENIYGGNIKGMIKRANHNFKEAVKNDFYSNIIV